MYEPYDYFLKTSRTLEVESSTYIPVHDTRSGGTEAYDVVEDMGEVSPTERLQFLCICL